MDNGFEIYRVRAGGERLVQVSDPLHLKILHLLAESPLSATEISALTEKAQSTLSVHLDTMVSQSLISYQADMADSRKKIYSLVSDLMARSKEPDENGQSELRRYISTTMYDSNSFYKDLLMSLFLSAESYGMDISRWTYRLGCSFADSIFEDRDNLKVEDVIRDLQDFYERNSLGEVCIYTFLPLTIIIRNCDEFSFKMESFASFSHGLFSRALTKVTGVEYSISRSEIFGTGNNYYKFILNPVD